MKHLLKLLLIFFFANFALASYPPHADKDPILGLQRFRIDSRLLFIGIKIGLPNILSGGVEVAVPVLGNRFAPFVDYGNFKYNSNTETHSLNSFEYGLNVYLKSADKGLYAGLSQSSMKMDFTFNSLTLLNNITGTGTTGIKINTHNIKLGYKTGGRVYVRVEAGYGIGDIPKELNFIAKASTSTGQEVAHTEPLPDIPGVGENGMVIGNIGVGFSF